MKKLIELLGKLVCELRADRKSREISCEDLEVLYALEKRVRRLAKRLTKLDEQN